MYQLPANYVGASCLVKTMDNELLTNGRIIKIGSDFIEISNVAENLKIVKIEEPIKVEISHGELPSQVIEGKIYLPNARFFRLVDYKALAIVDKRAFFRVIINERALINKKTSTGEYGNDFSIQLMDISLGGALIKSPLVFSVDTKISLVLVVNGMKHYINGKIVRKLPRDASGYSYGIKFTDNTPTDTDVLCRYVFSKEKEQIQNLKK